MKKILSLMAIIPTLLFAQTAIWNGTADTTWFTNNKDAAEFIITTAEQLAGLAVLIDGSSNNGTYNMHGITIKLGNDIALNDTANWKNWDENPPKNTWMSMGEYSGSFLGTFDGDDNIIIGIYYGSLFNAMGHSANSSIGTIQNLGILASYIKDKDMGRSASLTNYNYGSIINSYTASDVIGGNQTGGLVAYNYGSIVNSYATGNVIGNSNVGGLIGINYGSVTYSYATGNVIGNSSVGATGNSGGLIGVNYGSVTYSYATGNVIGNNGVGGLIGENRGSITYSYATGNVFSNVNNAYVGGLAGSSGGTISNSYATGNVAGGERQIGGLVGSGSSINSYAIGKVSGGSYYVGGLAGSGSSTNSYYNTQTSEQEAYGAGTGKTTAEMQNILTYLEGDWDFNSVWAIHPDINDGYPFLQESNLLPADKKSIANTSEMPIYVEAYTGEPIELAIDSALYKEIDYDVVYLNNLNAGTNAQAIIVGKGSYYGIKASTFHIITNQKRDITYASVDPIFPQPITGDFLTPKPMVRDFNGAVTLREGKDYVLEYAENKYTGQAAVKITGIGNIYDGYRTAGFSIVGRLPLRVTWTEEREFVYNKMVQVPMPSVEAEDVELRVVNARSEAGTYAGVLAPFAQIISANANSYELINNTVEYTIKKKPLTPYFTANMQNFETNNADTLWVPREIFANQTLLKDVLSELVSYNGFAKDTIKNESDNASVLKGKPTVSLEFPSPVLSKRVETTQKATATIVTDEVSADNYALTRPIIIIMETIDENEDAETIYCYHSNYCAKVSKQICSAIEGEEVQNCSELRKTCAINNVCVESILLNQCIGLGGTVIESCAMMTSIISGNPAYYTPVARYYNLNGTPLGTHKPTTPGIYIEKVGKNAKKILVK